MVGLKENHFILNFFCFTFPFFVFLGTYYCMSNLYNNKKPDARERALEHGLSFPYDEELIMMILGSGNKNMPVNIMAGKILEVLDESEDDKIVENLLKLKGVGKSKALAVAAAIELGKRRSNHLRAPVRHPGDILPFVRNYAISDKEHFLVVTLNGGHEIINIHCVTVGTVNRTLIHPREVFNIAIKENAAAIIVCHNHPSGKCKPSDDDLEATQMLIHSSYIIGIDILDHIIIDRESYYSFMENKLLFSES